MNQYIAAESLFIFRLVPWNGENDYVSIIKPVSSICSSPVGKMGGMQTLKLGGGCANRAGIAMHEFMHAIGTIATYYPVYRLFVFDEKHMNRQSIFNFYNLSTCF